MSDFASRPDAGLDQWLAAQHRHMVTDLAAILDLGAGLREAMIPARHANLVADLGGVLDVETGLSAIVPTASDPTPHKPETIATSYTADAELVAAKGRFETDPQQTSPDPMSLTDLENLVRAAASPSTRLAMRTHPAFDLARALDHVLDSARTRALAHALAHARDLALARALARALVRDLARDLARASDLTLARDLALALDLARDLASDLASDLAAIRALDLARALDRALDQMTRVVAALHHALNDFTGVDLGSVDLAGIPLDGLRWSTETRWPPQWAEQIRRDSVEVGDGIFEVRGGNRYALTTV